MTDEEIISRIEAGEDSRTQFKREAIGVNDLAKELAAFANAEGGVILFGVDDDGSVAGLTKKQSAAVNAELSNAASDNVRPSVYPRTEFHRIGGKTVLAVIVAEGVSKPYADKHGSFWTKNGPDKRRVTAREELQRMLQKSLLIHADELPVEKTSVRDLDLVHLAEYLEKNYAIPSDDVRDGRADLPQLLQNLGFMDGTLLTLAGVMLFAKNPQRFCPVNVVKAVAFYGNDSSSSRFRDTADIAGSLRDMFNGTMRFLKENLRHLQVGTEFNQLGELDVSEEALKEVVANMFLHRDYFVSSPWRVMIFDDRVELISPGSLPNHLNLEKIKFGVSVPRNPVLFSHATKEIPYRGIGTGIKRALELQEDIVFENDEDGFFFKTTFKRIGSHKKVDIGAKRVDIGSGKVDIDHKKVDIGSGKVDIDPKKVDIGLSAVNARKYNLLVRKFRGEALFRRADVVRLLGLKPAMASRFIAKLVSLKLIVPVTGKGKGAYRVATFDARGVA